MSSFVREVVLGATARPFWAALTVVTAATLVGVPALLQMIERDALNQARIGDLSKGANVLSLTSTTGGLSGEECDSLSQWDGVRQVGHASGAQTVRVDTAPRDPFQSTHVSLGYVRILTARDDLSGSMFVASSAATELGVASGSRLRFGSGSPIAVDAVIDVTVRAVDQSRWLYFVIPTPEVVRQCLVEVNAGATNTIRQAIRSGFTQSSDIDVETLALAEFPEARNRWDGRPTRYLWLLGGLMAAVAPVLMILVRRGEFSVYVLAGFSRLQATLVLGGTNWLLGLVAASGALAGACLGLMHLHSDEWTDLARVGLANVIAAVVVQHSVISLAHMCVVIRGLSSATRARP